MCPFAQRPWIARNCKGLQDKIKLVAIDLENRPIWYKEKVYPGNKEFGLTSGVTEHASFSGTDGVPSLEHNGKVVGESLDLIKYIDDNFEGRALLPDDSEKQKFSEELIGYSETFLRTVYMSFRGKDPVQEAAGTFDYLETAFKKFNDGPSLLGPTISLADIAYAPFVERFQGFFEDVWKHDITSGRPKLGAWIEEMNKIDAYKQTKCDMNKTIQDYRVRFLGQK